MPNNHENEVLRSENPVLTGKNPEALEVLEGLFTIAVAVVVDV